MVLRVDGEVVGEGEGRAAMGTPLNCVAWLANTMGALGSSLVAGDIILSGSLGPMIPAKPGQKAHLQIDGIGTADITFS